MCGSTRPRNTISLFFFFSSRRRHTRSLRDWSSDVCSSDLIGQAQSLSGRHADVVHVVGGGARNALLCQLTADATGLPVIAGPAEATCFGNVLVQARALGAAPGDLAGMRALIRSTQPLRSFTPTRDSTRDWADAAARI